MPGTLLSCEKFKVKKAKQINNVPHSRVANRHFGLQYGTCSNQGVLLPSYLVNLKDEDFAQNAGNILLMSKIDNVNVILT